MKKITTLILFIVLEIALFAQGTEPLSRKLKSLTKKGDYIVLELRLNKEDEFRTIEGSTSSLARIAVFTGKNEENEIIAKGFDGMNSIVTILNDLKSNGWLLSEVYNIKGDMLIITHYVLERKK